MKKKIIFLSIINVLRSSLLIVEAFLAQELIDLATNHESLLLIVIIFISVIVFLLLLSILSLFIKNRLSLKIEVNLKQKIYDSLLNKNISSLRKYHSGEISNIYLNDINNINIGISEIVPSLSLYSSRFVFSIIAIGIISPYLILILLALASITFIIARIYSKYIKKYHRLSLDSDGKINAFMQESIENIKVIKGDNCEENFKENLNQKIKENYRLKNQRNILSLVGNSGFSLFMNLISACALIVGAILIKGDNISFGQLTTLTMLVSYFEGPISGFGNILSRYNAYKVSKQRVDELLALNDDLKRVNLNDFDKIVFDNVSFSYDYQVLDKLSFTFNKNETLLIKGPSGKGKSTIFNLLLGFIVPDEGSIKVKFNDKEYFINEVSNLFAYVVQDNILFSGTVRENINLFVKNAAEEEIIEALKTACIYDELMAKDKQLDTLLYERNGGLSLGQVQRILLAINLLLKRPILLLDEFTSSLDRKLEEKIVHNVMKKNVSKIIITHHDLKLKDVKILDLGEKA